ncbi:COPII coat assembly protein sec16 [Ceratocystis lukuohia]|uniref:Protein transport protein sec16 n=1 Tax=Ceratocystis lukuohia TaxID=2019550 RepID=A0ABR4MHM4_9PEZI
MSSSWHPAFMPSAAHAGTSTPEAASAENPGTLVSGTAALQEPAEILAAPLELSTALAGFDQQESQQSPSQAVLASESASTPTSTTADIQPNTAPESTTTPIAASAKYDCNGDSDAEAAAEARDSVDPTDPSPVISPHFVEPKAGHWSSMSFARTAQEVNFDDDDGGEWGLQRTATDPFRFMAPNERSNSFPVVPPSAHHSRQASEVHPMPDAATAALASVPAGADDGHFDTPHGAHNALTQHPFDGADGDDDGENAWDLKPVDEDILGGAVADGYHDDGFGAGSRFEEGVPLIAQAEQEISPAVADNGSAFVADEPDADDDDFFSRAAAVTSTIEASSTENGGENITSPVSHPPTLERKSTIQAMGSLNMPQETAVTTPLESMAEESGSSPGIQSEGARNTPEMQSEKTEIVPQTQTVIENTSGPEKAFADDSDAAADESGFFDEISQHAAATPAADPAPSLEAKWDQAFADDDDDAGFLDGPGPEVDVDGFLSSDDGSLLEDDDDNVDALAAQTAALNIDVPASSAQAILPANSNSYLPSTAGPYQNLDSAAGIASNPYAPVAASPATAASAYNAMPPPARPELQKVASFADRSKSGYTSPYDLPIDVKPRRRPSAQAVVRPGAASTAPPSGSQYLPGVGQAVPPSSSQYPHETTPSTGPYAPAGSLSAQQTHAVPFRSSSFSSSAYSPVPPAAPAMAASPYTSGIPPSSAPPAPNMALSPPGSRDASSMAPPPVPGSGPPLARPSLVSKGSGFFEDLPIVAKPRSGLRAPGAHAASPGVVGPPAGGLGASGAAGGYFPVQPSPLGPVAVPQAGSGLQMVPPPVQPPVAQPPSAQSTSVLGLVSPDRVNPYSPSPTTAAGGAMVAPPSSRYSPAPSAAVPPAGQHPASAPPGSGPPPALVSRYSPAPPASRPTSSYAPAVPNPALPHQPRTSSPLAYMEVPGNEGQGHHPTLERRSSHSSQYEYKQTRVSSLPPTREVDEDSSQPNESVTAPVRNPSHDSRYSPASASAIPASLPSRSTPPPAQSHVPLHPSAQSTLSPPKRTNANYVPNLSSSPRKSYAPNAGASGDMAERQTSGSHVPAAAPPATLNPYAPVAVSAAAQAPYTPVSPVPYTPITAAPGQSSMPTPTGTTVGAQYPASVQQPAHRARAPSLTLNLIPPTDGREHDPLQRWKGNPIISWSVSGNIVTSFPKSIPRYTAGVSAPTVFRTAGEISVHHIKDMVPLDERLVHFPGPLKGKGKKKEVVAWLSSGIEALERELPDLQFAGTLSLEQNRAVERILLWKLLRIMVENDGAVDGSETVVKAVRELLTPGLDKSVANDSGDSDYLMNPIQGISSGHITGKSSGVAAEAVDSTVIDQIKRFLALGDGEKAAWAAADKRLWGHAMLIANSVSTDLYKQVAQEFVRKEVNYANHKNESLAALYKVLSGNPEECVDELVSSHARAGLQLVAAAPAAASGLSGDSLEGLDKWRETVSLILSNRSSGDLQALVALGDLLLGYGRPEASHVCFLFAKSAAVFSGLDDPRANFVLVGADHRGQADQFAKEIEPLLLSDVFEYALSLAPVGTSAAAYVGAPHLTAYRLHLAMALAEYGHRDKALQYCEAIITAMNAQTRRSPYHHPILEITVDDLLKRLRSAPKEETNSWLPKPSMNKVSDSMWNRFNKFVAGDGEDGAADASGSEAGGGDIGPFARIAGGTPTISRSPSVANFSDAYPTGMPNLAGPLHAAFPAGMASPPSALSIPPGGRATSRYAPSPMLSSSVPAVNPYAPALPGQPMSDHGSSRVASHEAVPGQPPTSYFGGGHSAQPTPPAAGLSSPSLKSPISFSAAQGQSLTSPYAPMPPAEPQPQTQAPASSSIQDASPAATFLPPSYNPGYEPEAENKSTNPSVADSTSGDAAAPADTTTTPTTSGGGGFEPPSFQPYSYEPPSYEPGESPTSDNDEAPKPKKKSFMDDDDDDIPALKRPQATEKSERDRENEEMFRRIAEEEAKKAEEEKAAKAKKGWGFGGWFGGKKETASPQATSSGNAPADAPKATRANLGEASSFVYDPDLKRWVNKKPGADTTEAKKPAPPPPRSSGSTPATGGTPPSGRGTPPPPARTGSVPPPMGGTRGSPSTMARSASMANLSGGPPAPGGAPPLPSSGSGGPPPSRPGTSMSNASSIDDLLSVAPRAKGAKNKKRGGRYVDVMANGAPSGL